MLEVRQTMFMTKRLRTFYEFNFPCHLHIKSQQYDKTYPFHILYALWEPHALHQYMCARSDNPQTENVFIYHTPMEHCCRFLVP